MFAVRPRWPRRPACQLLGLPARLVLRAPRGVRQPTRRARRRRRVPRPGQGAPPGRASRSSSTSSTTTPPRSAPDGPTFGFRGLANDDYYLLDGDGALRSTTAARGNTLNANDADRPPADPRQPPLLGRRRCTSTASGSTWPPSCRATRPASRWRDPPTLWDIETRPGPGRHQAHRRGLGRRRAVPGRQLRGRSLGGVERPLPRRRPLVRQERSRARPRRSAQRFLGSPDIYGAQAARAAGERQLRDLPRRLHAQRPRLLRRQAQRGERRGQPRRQRPEPELELRRRRARPTTRRSSALRARQIRNLLALDLLSLGAPMLLMGDEVRRTQGGNNNAYCHDDATSWFDWTAVERHADVLRFTQRPHRRSAAGSRTLFGRARRHRASLEHARSRPRSTGRRARSGARTSATTRAASPSTIRADAGRAPPHLQRLLGAARLRAARRRRRRAGWRRILDTSLDAPGRHRVGPRAPPVEVADDATASGRARSVCWRRAATAGSRRHDRRGRPMTGRRARADGRRRATRRGLATRPARGTSGGRTCPSAPGARSARTTARTAMRGRPSRTTTPARAPTAGTRTAWPASPTSSTGCASALALWNGHDPILKERMFGLTNSEGNHGEDVKEYWWYLDALPSSAWLRWRYHYPQAAVPVRGPDRGRTRARSKLRARVRAPRHRRLRRRPLLDRRGPLRQGDPDRHPDADHGRATAGPRRRPSTSCRRCGSATNGRGTRAAPQPELRRAARTAGRSWRRTPSSATTRSRSGPAPDGSRPTLLFCENETNLRPDLRRRRRRRRTRRTASTTTSSTAPRRSTRTATGTKAAAWYRVDGRRPARPPSSGCGCQAGREPRAVGRRGRAAAPRREARPRPTCWAIRSTAFDDHARARREADEFYAALRRDGATRRGTRSCARPSPACSGASSTTATTWRAGWTATRACRRRPPSACTGRNADWRHFDAADIISMPDPWEYPWFAAWDLAFHAVTLAHIDPAFAKYQLLLLCREWFQHPNGALPAYEWSFDDVNPPVHAAAAYLVWTIDGAPRHRLPASGSSTSCCSTSPGGSTARTRRATTCSRAGSSASTTSAPSTGRTCRPGTELEQSDATAWMFMYCLNMLRIATVLAEARPGVRGLRDHVHGARGPDRARR